MPPVGEALGWVLTCCRLGERGAWAAGLALFSQDVLAVKSASHKAQAWGSQKNAFATNIFRLTVWGTRRFSPTPLFEYIIQAVKTSGKRGMG